MKKRICLILSVLLGALLAFTVCSCSNTTKHLEKEIVSAYIQQNDLKLGKNETLTVDFYGEFDGVYVVYFHGLPSGQALTDLTVGGVDYHFRNTQVFDVYRDGKFYTLQDAFNNGYLTRADLVTVRESHKAEDPALYVNADFDNEIKAAYLQTLPGDELTVYDLTLKHVVQFQHTYVVEITGPWDVDRSAAPSIIGNVFFDPEMDYIAYRYGKFYSIRDAYKNKFLTHENLLTLQKMRKAAAPGYFDVHDTITQEIVSAYAEKHGIPKSNVEQPIFYGIFSNIYVMLLEEKSLSGSTDGPQLESTCPPMETELIVDDVYFCHPAGKPFTVYHDGEFYTLQEAFDNGYLTHGDLVTVQENHKAANPDLYGSTELDQIKNKIVFAYAEKRGIPKSNVRQPVFYGIFQDTYVMMIYAKGDMFLDVVSTLTVDGITFQFGDSLCFSVYHAGEFYSLQEAFDNGFLTHDDLLTVQKNWNNR